MSNKRANRFEQALGETARGETVEGPLDQMMHTAQQLSTLADPPPPAPYKLAPGRQRFLSQAAVMRNRKASRKGHVFAFAGPARLVSGLTVAVLVLSLLFGVGQVMADSLPGEPLYGLKLLATEQRLRLTSDPQARLDLALNAVGERLNEIAETIEAGQTMNQSTTDMLQKHLGIALDTVDEGAQDPLQTMTQNQATIQSWHRRMVQAMGAFPETDREPLRDLARATEQLRLELHAGAGEAQQGGLYRERLGEPKDPADMPVPGEQQGLGPQAGQEAQPEEMPAGPGPKPEETPTGDDAPVSAGPGPGPQAPEETSGTGPAEQQPGPVGPADNGADSGGDQGNR